LALRTSIGDGRPNACKTIAHIWWSFYSSCTPEREVTMED